MPENKKTELKRTFERLWSEVRGARLFAGQPRSERSAAGVNLAHEALRLALEAGDDDFLLEAWRMLAYSLAADERWAEAIPYYEDAIKAYEARGQHAFAARNLRIGYVSALMLAGRYQDALGSGAIAEEWLKKDGDDAGYARLCTNIANLHQRLDQYQLSCEYYDKALRIFESTGDRQAMALIYQNLGYPLGRLNRFEEADAMYARAAQMAIDLNMPGLGEQASYNRAYLFFMRGRYGDALDAFAKVRERFADSGSQLHFALCDLDESEIYLQLNIPDQAVLLAHRASQQFEKLGMTYETAKAHAFEGIAFVQMKRFADSLEAFRIAQKLFSAEGNNYWAALTDLYRAHVHLQLQRYKEAQSLATQAKGRFESLAIRSRSMLSQLLLGHIALHLGDLQSAERHAAEIGAGMEEAEAGAMRFPFHMLDGEIAERNKDFARAEELYSLAAEDLEMHQSRLQHDDLRVLFLNGRSKVYESLVRLSLENKSAPVERGYSWCERAKSGSLIELISNHLPAIHSRGEPSLLRRIDGLREELNLHYAQAKADARTAKSAQGLQTLLPKEKELSRALREVSIVDPEYVSLQHVSAVGLSEAQNLTKGRTTFVEYFTTDDEVLAFVISAADTKVFRRLAPSHHVRSLQERLDFQLEKYLLRAGGKTPPQSLDVTNQSLFELHSTLVKPLISDIGTSHVTIIPHGTLHSLPFHALFDGKQYLTDHFEIAYSPSVSVLSYCMEALDVAGTRPRILGIVDEANPTAGDEADAIAALYPDAEKRLGATATRAEFSKAAGACSFVHLATHAVFRHDNPMFSSFKLADGDVTALDLFSMTCRTNLVTLSASHSITAGPRGSDALLGLARGFLYAGARSLLLNLWNVRDESASVLLKHFYEGWQKGLTRAAALRAAQEKLRQTHPHPFQWSPFFLIGNSS